MSIPSRVVIRWDRHRLVPVILLATAAGLIAAAVAGCGGASGPRTGAGSSPAATPTASQAATQADVASTLSATISTATGFHVRGVYTWPHARLSVNADLLQSGALSGRVVDDGEAMTLSYVGGKMYTKLTPSFLAYLGKSGECATLCGRWAVAKRGFATGLLASMGVNSTEHILSEMALAGPTMTSVTFDGRAAYRWSPPGYGKGAYIIVAATPRCVPLKVDVPGRFVLVFSQWNAVSAPTAPPRAKVQAGAW